MYREIEDLQRKNQELEEVDRKVQKKSKKVFEDHRQTVENCK